MATTREELERERERAERWKRRAKIFQRGYRDKSVEATALLIQKIQLEALGADKVTAMQNRSLRGKLLEACRERNALRAALKKANGEA